MLKIEHEVVDYYDDEDENDHDVEQTKPQINPWKIPMNKSYPITQTIIQYKHKIPFKTQQWFLYHF